MERLWWFIAVVSDTQISKIGIWNEHFRQLFDIAEARLHSVTSLQERSNLLDKKNDMNGKDEARMTTGEISALEQFETRVKGETSVVCVLKQSFSEQVCWDGRERQNVARERRTDQDCGGLEGRFNKEVNQGENVL